MVKFSEAGRIKMIPAYGKKTNQEAVRKAISLNRLLLALRLKLQQDGAVIVKTLRSKL